MCKKCKKAFRKDMTNYEESDEYCPHCDNHYVSSVCRFWSQREANVRGTRSLKRRHRKQSWAWKETTLESTLGEYMLSSHLRSRPTKGSIFVYTSMLKDERQKQDPTRSLLAMDFTDRVG